MLGCSAFVCLWTGMHRAVSESSDNKHEVSTEVTLMPAHDPKDPHQYKISFKTLDAKLALCTPVDGLAMSPCFDGVVVSGKRAIPEPR